MLVIHSYTGVFCLPLAAILYIMARSSRGTLSVVWASVREEKTLTWSLRRRRYVSMM